MRRRWKEKIAAWTLAAALTAGLFLPQTPAYAGEQPESGWSTETVSVDDLQAEAGSGIGEALTGAGGQDAAAQEDTVQEDGAAASDALTADELDSVATEGCTTVSGSQSYTNAYAVLDLVNQQRAANGLGALAMDADLLAAAMLRAAEITVSFSHTRPSGQDCFSVSSKSYGENIAYGYSSASDVMTAWMNSEGHKANILTSGYTSIGVGCFYYNNTYYWVQIFGYNTPEAFTAPSDQNVSVEVVTDLAQYSASYTLASNGISVVESDPRSGFVAYMQTNAPSTESLEYSWYVSTDGGNSWTMVIDWSTEAQGIMASPNDPNGYGDYLIAAKARKAGDDSTTVMATFTYGYHPVIKGICQMPYTGEGGGYLIGIESYENPNNSYTYEMLILDCTLLAQGKDAWTYTTGRCGANGTCLWTVWQPQYGYYWTLFRVYDENGSLIDEQCYGFENIC